MKKLNLNDFIDKIKDLYHKNNFQEVSSLDLKKLLNNEELNMSGNEWGGVLGQLLTKNIIQKNQQKKIRIEGNVIFFYGPGSEILKEKAKGNKVSFVILDQNGLKHEYLSDDVLDDTLNEILNKNPNLELTVLKPIKRVKAEFKLVTTIV